MIGLFVEGALRALLVAGAVWAGMRLLKVKNVVAQKAAWGLVLAAAVGMPLLLAGAARWQPLPGGATVRIPAELVKALGWKMNAVETLPEAVNEPVVVAEPRGFVLSRVPKSEGPGAPIGSGTEPIQGDPGAGAPGPQRVEAEDVGAGGAARFPAPVISNKDATPRAAWSPFIGQGGWLSSAARLGGAVYFAIALLLLARLLHGLGSALRIWRSAEPVPDAVGARCAERVQMRWSSEVATPVTIGRGVLLPEGYAEWEERKLRVVVAHEASHVRQGDFYLQMLAGAYAALVWISPLGWWLKHELSELSEAISDRAGLEEAASGTLYARILLEFAALPRSTVAGVAMAHPSNLSARIERLLNESSFKQAFAGGRRALLAVLLVPAIFAASALIRVEAATGHTSAAAQTTGVSHPDEAAPEAATDAAPAVPAEAPEAAAPADEPVLPPPAAAGVVPVQGVSPVPTVAPVAGVAPVPAIAPVAPVINEVEIQAQVAAQIARDSKKIQEQAERATTRAVAQAQRAEALAIKQQGFAYHFADNGDSYALLTGKDQRMNFSGNWSGATSKEIEKARKQAKGKCLWFRHNGKSYLLSDPAAVAQVESMYQPMEALAQEQAQFAKQQAEFAVAQAKLGEEMEKASIPTPDVSKEMAELNAAVAKLQASQSKTMTSEQWADLQSKIGNLQGKLGEIQGKLGALEGLSGEKMGKLGEIQGKIGEKQGLLGEKEGKLAMEADRKVKAIIEQSLKDGKAKPVE